MSLTRYAVRRPVSTIAATLAVVLLGSVSITRLPVSLLPDVELPVLTIRTNYPGAAAPEVSRFIAEPIEQAIAATPGLVELRSVSRNGQATTIARFGWGTDMKRTVLTVRERLDAARGALPDVADRPTLLTSDPGERPIAVISLTGEGDLRSLARAAEDVHARRLEQIAGVASVAIVGRPNDEIRVEVDPERLRALNIAPDEVANAIRAANVSAPGGTIRRGQFRFSVRALTELRTLDEISATPVGPQAAGVKLRDIARVSLATADPVTVTRYDGAPAIGLVVYKEAGANTVAVTDRILATVAQLADEVPAVRMNVVASQARFVTAALANLEREIVIGGSLALLVILLFLRDFRSSLAIGVMVPLSVLLALVLLQALDVSINVLSLGGLALGVGLLVDNAIVVTEASKRHWEETGLPRDEATISATEIVSGPLIAGTLTTILVFGPIVFVKGLAAALFRDLSLSVVTSVGASLLLALTLMPVLIVGRRVNAQRRAANSQRKAPRATKWLDSAGYGAVQLYDRGVEWSLSRPRTVILAAAATTGIAAFIAVNMPREILPQVDEGIVVADVKLPEGTALDETIRQVSRIEDAARRLGARGVYSRVGLATDEEMLAGAEPGSSAAAQLLIAAPEGATAASLAPALRERLPDLVETGAIALDVAGQTEFGSLIGREGRVVRVEVGARTLDEAQLWADNASAAMRGIATLADVRNAHAPSQPVVEMRLDRDRIAQRGLRVEAVVSAVSGALGGVAAGDLRETDRRTPITVRFAGDANENLDAALAATVSGVPVSQLVTYRDTRAPIEVVRVNQRPVTIVEGLIERGGTARAARDSERAMASLAPPTGVTFAVTGADAEQRRTTEQLLFVALLAVALVFLVMAGKFASFTVPFVVMTTVPLAGVGGILLLWATGQSINAVSLIGLVVMIGLADNDAVVKLDAIRRFRESGHSLRDAIVLGGRQRLRPITMTSLTTIAGVSPLVFGIGSGGALYQPLAAGVIGGSVSLLLVTFFLLPVVYWLVEGVRERRVPDEGIGSLAALGTTESSRERVPT